jgi:hypothetical protein
MARVRRLTGDRPRESMIRSPAPISPLINRNGAWLTGQVPLRIWPSDLGGRSDHDQLAVAPIPTDLVGE